MNILCRKLRRVGMEVMTGKITNPPELLSRLQEVDRCMALSSPSAADEVLIACRALAHTTEAESPEIAAAGADLARAAGGVGDSASNLRLHLCLQTLMARIQAAAESSQAGRIWAAAQNLAELLLVTSKFLDDAPEPSWAEEFPPALCGLEAVRREFSNFVSVLGWPPPPDEYGLDEVAQGTALSRPVDRPSTRGTAVPVPGRSQAGPRAGDSHRLDRVTSMGR